VSIIKNVLISVLIIVLGVGIARTVKKVTIRGLGEHIDINIRTLLGQILYVSVMTLAIFWVLPLWGVEFTAPVAALGLLTVAFTVAIQDILKNLVAGLYLLVEHPFHIGDQVTTSDYTGVVKDVQLRATRLHLRSGEEVAIPNSLIFGGIVVNNTFYEERRATITVTLAQEDFSQEQTPEQILNTISALDVVLAKPEPTLTVSSFTGAVGGYTGLASGYTGKTVTLTVRFWIASRQFSVVTDVMYALRQALPNADLAVRESAGDI
jgi:small-conductance mechanosensitive channel